MTFSPEWLAAFFAGVSLLGAVFGYFGSRSVAYRAFRLEWTREVLNWGGKAVDSLSVAHTFAKHGFEIGEVGERKRKSILADISSLADRGRFFFENKPHGRFGIEKPTAYRGIRPDLLTYLIRAYQALENLPSGMKSENISEQIFEQKRQFVSELQRIVDTRWLSKRANYKVQKATL
ncbi:MAG TPA: hypothetical protein VIJ72_06805 [Rhizomicrobium sp.]